MGSPTLWRRLVARIRRNRLERELAEEIELHIDQRRQSLIDDGMDPEQAAGEARRAFGNTTVIRERARDLWTLPTFSSMLQDLRYAWRTARRTPGYTAIVVLTIALGTGLNAAVFVLINAFILRPPDVVDAHDVVRLDDGKPVLGPTYPDYVDYRDRATAAIDLAAHASINLTARIERSGESFTERVDAVLASGNYFDVLKVRALHGRTFDGREDLPPIGTPVAVIGEDYWTRRFDRDPEIVGRKIDLNHRPFTVIGVVPNSFKGADVAGAVSPTVRELYVPLWTVSMLEPNDNRLRQRTMWWGLQSVGRLRPGSTVASARAEVGAVAAALDREYPGQRHQRRPHVAPITDVDTRLFREETGIIAGVSSAATLLVLFIGCANVANLGFARSFARSRETAVRLSLGAGRWRLVRQFLTESLLLSGAGTVLGFALGTAVLRIVAAIGDDRPLAVSLAPDFTVFAYASLLAIGVSLATGLVPALQASNIAVLPALKEGQSSRRSSRLRAMFVGAEVASCLVVLVVMMLMVRGAGRASAIDPVIPVDRLLHVDAGDMAQLGYAGQAQVALLNDIARRVETVPGVTAVVFAQPAPFSGYRHATMARRLDAADRPGLRAYLSNVEPRFFTVAGLPILRGRAFAAASRNEVVVNETFAAALWGDGDPIGQSFVTGEFARSTHFVVGVVRDSPFVSLRLRNEPFMFRPIDLSGGASIVVRTAGPAATLAKTVEQTARSAAPLVSFAVTPLADGIAQEITALRSTAAVVGGLGGLALVLAMFGVGAVTANAVAQRTHEIGVRMALGASTTDAVAFVVRQSMRAVIGGAVAGGIVAALLSRALTSLLYGLSSVDPVAFVSAALFLMVASTLAAWLPARGAARVDPLIALRAE